MRPVYDRLWRGAVKRFKQGDPQIDPHLKNLKLDGRRGVTLALRPEPAVQTAVKRFLRQLAAVAPGQHFYQPDEMHVTVLGVIPGSVQWREKMTDLAAIQAVIGKVLERRKSFAISFRGVTASPEAVMIQGFLKSKALAQIRNELRTMLRENRLGGGMDERYKINTAHMTVMRFSHARVDGKALIDLLKANRKTDFGETRVGELQLLWGNWYASASGTRIIQEYPLATDLHR
jgi:2'-5' RNA ligase